MFVISRGFSFFYILSYHTAFLTLIAIPPVAGLLGFKGKRGNRTGGLVGLGYHNILLLGGRSIYIVYHAGAIYFSIVSIHALT